MDLPLRSKLVCYKWNFKRKIKTDRTIDKARLVIKGYKQREYIDYFDTYYLVTLIILIRMILTIATL